MGRVDVALALQEIEPVCAGLCAERPDRATGVVPQLRAALDAAAAAVDDLRAYTEHCRHFHEGLVAACGNRAIAAVLGPIETVCSADAARWLEHRLDGDGPAVIVDRDYRVTGLHEHAEILACIEAGDRQGAEVAARRHGRGRASDG